MLIYELLIYELLLIYYILREEKKITAQVCELENHYQKMLRALQGKEINARSEKQTDEGRNDSGGTDASASSKRTE